MAKDTGTEINGICCGAQLMLVGALTLLVRGKNQVVSRFFIFASTL